VVFEKDCACALSVTVAGAAQALRLSMTAAHLTSLFTLSLPRPLKNYLRCRYGVKNGLKMLIYNSKLRFFGRFCLVSAASATFFNGLLGALATSDK
jgi:hypothetical protein